MQITSSNVEESTPDGGYIRISGIVDGQKFEGDVFFNETNPWMPSVQRVKDTAFYVAHEGVGPDNYPNFWPEFWAEYGINVVLNKDVDTVLYGE